MNKPNQQLLSQFLEEILERQLALQTLKRRLADSHAFSSKALFRKITLHNNKPITIKQFQDQMAQTGRKLTNDHAFTVFFYFDAQRKGQISLKDFQREITPFNVDNSTITVHETGEVTHETEQAFGQLIDCYIERQRILDVCREELMWIEPWVIFDQLTPRTNGYITPAELYLFMQSNDVTLCQEQLNYLMRGLRLFGCRKVTLEILSEFLQPRDYPYRDKFQQQLGAILQSQKIIKQFDKDAVIASERIDSHNQRRKNNRTRRRKLANIQYYLEKQDVIKERIQQVIDEQYRNLRRKELEIEKQVRQSVVRFTDKSTLLHDIRGIEPAYKRFSYASLLDEEQVMPTARRSYNQSPSRFQTSTFQQAKPGQLNLIYNNSSSMTRKSVKQPLSETINGSSQSTIRMGRACTTREPKPPKNVIIPDYPKVKPISEFRV